MASAIKIIAGLFIVLIGFPIFIGGSAVLLITPVFTDNEGYFMTQRFHLSQNGVTAVRFDIPLDVDFGGVRIDPSKFVTLKMEVTGPSQSDVFLGLTTGSEADTLLESVSYLLITDFEYLGDWQFGDSEAEYTLEWIPVANSSIWEIPDVTAPYWIVGGTNDNTFKWAPTAEDLEQGTLSVIVMNSDYTSFTGNEDSSIEIYFSIGAKVPLINAIGWILVVFGGLFTLLGIIIVWSGLRAKKPRTERIRYYQGVPAKKVDVIEKPLAKYQLQCSNCGSINEPESAFCSQCGEILLSEDRKTVEDITKGKEIDILEPSGNKLVIAEGWPRFWAWLIDIVIIGMISSSISSIVFFSLNNWDFWSFGVWSPFQWLFSFGPSSLFFFVYCILMEYYYGQTIGKMVLNLEIVSERTGERPTAGEIAISALGKAFFLPLDVFLGWISRDESQVPNLEQRITQKWAKTVVIEKQKEKEASARFVSRRF
ncbi:MAG: RDD family protein [Candidatus Hodarchaeota archaeon]